MKPYLKSVVCHRLFSTALSALLLILAMPGYAGFWPLVFIALVPLLKSVLDDPPVRCSVYGLVSGFLYHMVLLYWIIFVLGKYGGLPFVLSFAALVLLSLYMSLYTAMFFALTSFLVGGYWHREGPVFALFVWVAPVVWVGLDWLRGHVFSGFPWMDISYALYGQTRLIQAADLGGHHLITFCVVMVNALIVVMMRKKRGHSRRRCSLERRVILLACCVVVFAGGYSLVRYDQIALAMKRSLHVGVSLIQGNIAQGEKWSPAWQKKTVDIYIDLTRRSIAGKNTELVIWPETALPFYPNHNALVRRVQKLAKEGNFFLMTGAPWVEMSSLKMGDGEKKYYNSSLLFGPDGLLAEKYNKQHLVPFGEYVPFRKFLPFLDPLVESVGDFTAGNARPPFSVGQVHPGVLICFECIFPEIAAAWVKGGANLLVGMTNDAWYGHSSAPYHSLAMSVFRSIETKRSLVRAANTGISGFVDPLGNIIHKSALFEQASLSGTVPLLTEKTLFVNYGQYFGAMCFSLLLPLIMYRRSHL